MRRFGKYIVTASLTFSIGLVCTFLNGRSINHSPSVCEVAPSIDVETCFDTSGSIGPGFVKTSFLKCQYSDGSTVQQWSSVFRSSDEANSALQYRIKQASEIVRREPLLDENGMRIGERVVATFPANASSAPNTELLLTEHRTFVIQTGRSLESILDKLDRKR